MTGGWIISLRKSRVLLPDKVKVSVEGASIGAFREIQSQLITSRPLSSGYIALSKKFPLLKT
jgi:hypothetical protein